jgi:5-methylcytosine-specific restriction endonuclease McrA
MSINFNSTRCNYCERIFTESNYKTKEHIIPLSKGGNYQLENLVWVCNECNNFRGNKDLPYFYNQIEELLKNNRTIKIKIYTYNRNDLQNMLKNLTYYKKQTI